VIADGEPGIFDEHGRKATTPLLSEVFDGPATRAAAHFVFGDGKAVYLSLSNTRHREDTRRIAELLDAAGVKPRFPLRRPDGRVPNDVETYSSSNGKLTIVALQRDYVGPSASDSRETVVLSLPRPSHIYDIRAQKGLGSTDRLELDLGLVEPVLLTLSEEPISSPS